MASESLNTSLLPDYSLLRSQADWDYSLINYIESRGSVELAVAFSKLFWPDFLERDGCIIRADGFVEANFAAWQQRLNGDCAAIERVMNLLHVGDLVPSDTSDLDPAVRRVLGQTLVEMWAARVGSLFPDRQFVVQLEANGDEDEPTVLLYQRM